MKSALESNPSTTVVAFDFDGTIIDTELAEFEAWRAVEIEFGVPGLSGRVGQAIIEGPQHNTDKLTREVALIVDVAHFEVETFYRKALLNHSALDAVRPDVLTLIRVVGELGYRRVVCSGSSTGWIMPWLKKFDLLHFFEAVYGRNSWEPGHEKANAYDHLRSHYERKGATTFYAIEDSPRGVVAAQSGGWIPVYMPNGMVALDQQTLKSLTQLDLSKGEEFINGLFGAG